MSRPFEKSGSVVVAVIILATIFYFWHLSRPDIITDESSYATRAIRMVDFDFGIEQPTPWQWVDQIPWWMRLSFHDHPPLVFLVQHFSIALFGETPFAIRLPSVIAGLFSVALVYLVARRLYSPLAGLASAGLFAFTLGHVWISRIGLQESILISLMLGSFWAFLVGLERPRWLLLASIFLGLAFLAKYLALVLVPVFSIILIFSRIRPAHASDQRHALRFPLLLGAAALFVVIASPVIVYNIELWRNFGHFDFQFSLLFRQNVREWQARPGQESLGSLTNRITHFIPWLLESNSPYFLLLSLAGFCAIVFGIRTRWREHLPLLTTVFSLVPFLVFVGPAYRFLTLLVPWLAIMAGYGVSAAVNRLRFSPAGISLVLIFILGVEALYSYNTAIALNSAGPVPWTRAKVERVRGSWGFNELDQYLNEKLANKMPEVGITFQFPFAHRLIEEVSRAGQAGHRQAVPWAVVYNDNINLSAQLWVFLRRIVYAGWPVTSAENFRSRGGADFLRQSGIKRIIFVNATARALQDRTRPPTPDGDLIESGLRSRGARPQEIKNPNGETAFRIYEFEFQ